MRSLQRSAPPLPHQGNGTRANRTPSPALRLRPSSAAVLAHLGAAPGPQHRLLGAAAHQLPPAQRRSGGSSTRLLRAAARRGPPAHPRPLGGAPGGCAWAHGVTGHRLPLAPACCFRCRACARRRVARGFPPAAPAAQPAAAPRGGGLFEYVTRIRSGVQLCLSVLSVCQGGESATTHLYTRARNGAVQCSIPLARSPPFRSDCWQQD